MDEPKIVAGLHCFEVLERLDDYVEQTLSADLTARINEHLTQCSACASFGGRYAELVEVLQSQLQSERDSETARKLATALWRGRRGED